MIEGIVKYTLPYIGYPTIWLSEMWGEYFEK
jgi:hypothetical protein